MGLYVYLAGCLSHYHNTNQWLKAIKWRNEIDSFAKERGFKTFNPALTFKHDIKKGYNSQICVDQNQFYMDQSNLAIVNMNNILDSPGTIYELVTFKAQNKPVIAFGERTWSPHLNSCISHWCDNTDQIKDLISTMFCQNNLN